MRTRPSKTLFRIGRMLRAVPGMQYILTPMQKRYWHKIAENRNKAFLQNGLQILSEFDSIMQTNHIHYSLFAGTLLGAVREGGFLKHDGDIDTLMFAKDYSPRIRQLLEEHGFKMVHAYLIEDGKLGREETYEKDNVSVDIYFAYEDKNFPTYQCDFFGEPASPFQREHVIRARRLEFPISYNVLRVPFESIEVNILDNADEWLRCRYGEDYMTPDPSFHDKGDNPHIFIWEGVKACMITT